MPLMAPSPTASDRLLAVICLLRAGCALVSLAHFALGVHEREFAEQLVYPSTVRMSTLLLTGSLLLLLTLSLLSIAWRTGGSKSPRASSIAWNPLTMVLWSIAAAWWLLVNYPIPALAHHVDKYIVGLTILVLWSLAYLFVPRRLDAFVLSRIFKLGTLLAVNMLVFALAGEITFRLIDPWLARLGPFASKDTPSSLSPHTPIDGSIGQSNALGFRDREWSRHKTSTAPRIIAIGDSFTYGAGVSYDDTFVTLLAQAVADRIPGAEIFNMGVSSWGPHEELTLLKSTVLDFHPDLVILNVYVGNDIVEDARFEPALFVGGTATVCMSRGIDSMTIWAPNNGFSITT